MRETVMDQTEQLQITSEEYAQIRREHTLEWYNQHSDEEQKYLLFFDKLLASGSDSDHQKLLAFFSDEKNIADYKYWSNPIIEIIVIIDIYQTELTSGETNTILDIKNNGTLLTRPELLHIMQNLKFMLWRIEFCEDCDAEDSIITFIQKWQISPTFLCYYIERVNEQKLNMLSKMMSLTLNAGLITHTYRLLQKIDEYIPHNESIQQLLSQIKIMYENIEKNQ